MLSNAELIELKNLYLQYMELLDKVMADLYEGAEKEEDEDEAAGEYAELFEELIRIRNLFDDKFRSLISELWESHLKCYQKTS